MSLMHPIPEMHKLLKWLGKPARSPKQVHGLNESDSEILELQDGNHLVINIDSISEEISAGLYRDPFTMGWMAAQAALSDLAAAGAEPLGFLFSAHWSMGASNEFESEVSRGLQSALAEAKTFLLGGDTGESQSTVLTGVGIGIKKAPVVTRLGIVPGDYLCITGQSGLGPALAFQLLRGEETTLETEYRSKTRARLEAGGALASRSLSRATPSAIVNAIMDTSDGIVSTLNTLRHLNQVGLELYWNPEVLDPIAVEYCRAREIPLWLLWVGEHGDFQLITAIPSEVIEEARRVCPDLKIIGRATEWNPNTILRVSPGTKLSSKNFELPSFSESFRALEIDLSEFISLGKDLDPQGLASRLAEWTRTLRRRGFP